ncbi:MAG: 30S ribosomal protein S8 [Candidatus Portnoybacteria bacterium]|nr:30S ribosomal protein S8 [Candidatus Portnoybacteria bacterium]
MDQISDMLIRIKNAQKTGRASIEMPFSKLKFALAKILEKEKYLSGVEEKSKKGIKRLQINLKYDEGIPAIQEIVKKSKPSRRVYIKKNEILPVKQGYGISVISTPEGLMTGKEARRAGLGGELICELW